MEVLDGGGLERGDEHATHVVAGVDRRLAGFYQWAYERRIARVKIGGALRFRLSALEKLIAKSEVPALKAHVDQTD